MSHDPPAAEQRAAAGSGAAGRRMISPALVGRTEELAQLVSVVSTPPALVVVEGEAGIGKTRLMSELRARPELAGHRFAIGSCRRIREPFPLGPMIDVVRELGGELASATLSPVAGALRPLVPEVAHLLPPRPEPLGDRHAERHRVFRALVEVFASLGPTVLVLEDLHWADAQTVDFLSYLLAEPPTLSVVLTFRGEDMDPGARTLTAKLPSATRRTDIALAPLTVHETGELVAAILGIDHVSEEFAAHLRERASGLPFAIEEILALLEARGSLVRQGGGWARLDLEELEVPRGIRDSTLERVSRLSADARHTVETAAVLQRPVSVSVLVATAPSAGTAQGLGEAIRSGLLEEQGESVGFRHMLAAQAVYEAIPGPGRRELHRRAAAALAASRPTPLGQVAHHLSEAGQVAEWVEAAEKAADQAIELGHDGEAVRLLEAVVRHAPLDLDDRSRITVKLGWAAIEAVRTGSVIGFLSELLEQDVPRPVKGELQFLLASVLNIAGEDPALQRTLFAAAAETDGRPDLQARAMVAVGLLTASGVPLAECREWLSRALEILPKVDDPAVEVFVLGKVGMVLVMLGDPAWRSVLDRIVAATADGPRLRREVNAYYSVGVQASYAGHHDTAHRLLTGALAGAAACDSRRLELITRSALAVLHYLRGTWHDVAGDVEGLLDDLAEFPLARIDVEIALGCLALARGDLESGQRRLAGSIRLAEELGIFETLALQAGALARVALVRGDLDAALATALHCMTALEAKGAWATAGPVLPVAVEALVATGKAAEANSLLARGQRELRDLDVPIAPAALEHARGTLTAAAEQPGVAADHFMAAARSYERLPCPYQAAQSFEAAAGCLFDAGDERAPTILRVALEGYERLGASWDSARVSKTARRYGVSLPARHRGGRRGYGTALSPREREVARLAATGRTNKEIAEELFLSPKTVDKHLGAALRKLQIHSRAALARRLSDTAETVGGEDGASPHSYCRSMTPR